VFCQVLSLLFPNKIGFEYADFSIFGENYVNFVRNIFYGDLNYSWGLCEAFDDCNFQTTNFQSLLDLQIQYGNASAFPPSLIMKDYFNALAEFARNFKNIKNILDSTFELFFVK
jgi:hypothetical protein